MPLVLLLNWQQYRMEFLITAKYRTADMLQLWNGHLSGNLIILFGAIFSLLIIYLTNLEELVYIISIVTGIIIYRLVSNYR